jgi:hypothetical protein
MINTLLTYFFRIFYLELATLSYIKNSDYAWSFFLLQLSQTNALAF